MVSDRLFLSFGNASNTRLQPGNGVNRGFIVMNRDDIVSIQKNISFVGASTFTVEEAADKLAQFIGDRTNIAGGVWTGEGVKCRALQVGKGGWKDGVVRLSLEFIPDEDEENALEQEAEFIEIKSDEKVQMKQLKSPLDEFRQIS